MLGQAAGHLLPSTCGLTAASRHEITCRLVLLNLHACPAASSEASPPPPHQRQPGHHT